MGPQLIFRSPDGERAVRLDRPIVVGRDAACEVCIASVRLSRRHAEFSVGADGVTVRDLGSKNGILVNGAPVDHALLKHGDRVLLGDVVVLLKTKEATGTHRVAVPAPPEATFRQDAPAGAREASQPHPGDVSRERVPALEAVPAGVAGGVPESDKTTLLPAGGVLPPVASGSPEQRQQGAQTPAARPLTGALGARLGVRARVLGLGVAAGLLIYAGSVGPSALASAAMSQRDAESRAATIARLLAAENRALLASGQVSGVSVQAATREPGIRSARIIGADGHVLAPPERLDTTVDTLEGLGRIPEIRELRVARVGGEIHAAVPVDSGRPASGVAWLAFDPSHGSSSDSIVLLARLGSVVLALAIGLTAAGLMWRIVGGRVESFAQDVELVGAGRQAALVERYGIPALGRAVEAVNFLAERKPPRPADGASSPVAAGPPPGRAGAAGPSPGTAGGTVTLDDAYVVRAADAGAAALLGAAPDGLVGRHILEAPDRAVVDAVIDCLAGLGTGLSASRETGGPVARVTASRAAAAGPITLTLEPRREG
jgi:pSer/pThr/pTyr-binding forkhead associated (FHA) protein